MSVMGSPERLGRATRSAPSSTLYVRVNPAADDPFKEWVEDAVVELLASLRGALPPPSSDIAAPVTVAVIVALPPTMDDDPWRAAAGNALVEAVRGIVGSITMELGNAVRINTIVTRDEGAQATQDALGFLSSPRASFVAGSTFDLGGAECAS